MSRVKRAGLPDHSDTLEAMSECRRAMIRLTSAYPTRSGIYREAHAITGDLDDLALLLTGKRGYFLPPGHST